MLRVNLKERERERQKEIGERRQKYFIKITFILSIKIQNGLIHYSAQFNSVDCNTVRFNSLTMPSMMLELPITSTSDFIQLFA